MADDVSKPKTVVGMAFKGDLTPQSPEHTTRLVFAGGMAASGVLVIVAHVLLRLGAWSVTEAVLAIVLILGGVGIAFTGTVIALLEQARNIIPWAKKDA